MFPLSKPIVCSLILWVHLEALLHRGFFVCYFRRDLVIITTRRVGIGRFKSFVDLGVRQIRDPPKDDIT